MKTYRLIFTTLFISLLLSACKKEAALKQPIVAIQSLTDQQIIEQYLNLPTVPFNYTSPLLPAFYHNQFVTIQNNTPLNNPTSDWGATLGRVLFYDTKLSKNYKLSCASCHQQQFGFTDTAILSKGFMGGNTGRHSMALANARYYINGRFFWDERAATLEEQVLRPIQDKVEMGLTLDTLLERLKHSPYYPVLFKRAFGTAEINATYVSKALAQFVRSMVSYQSKYDEGRVMVTDRNADFPNFTAQENLGKHIFMTNLNVNCFGCHNTDAFITDNPRNNGLKATSTDQGIFIHTQNSQDIGKFKAPSLKNVALRGRYMHDGSLQGLMAVIEQYNSNIQMSPTLDGHLIDGFGGPQTMNLTLTEKEALKSFLETLTDNKMIVDPKFSSPFK